VRRHQTNQVVQLPDGPADFGPDSALGPAAVSVRGVSLAYGDGPKILDDFDLEVQPGEIVVLIGPSGCGKSTVLNLVAGTVRPDEGQVECLDQPVTDLNRQVAYMTQRDTLLPWRTALANAALPLEIRGMGRRERLERAREQLARVGVADAADRKPHQLSGGMRSRLALACTLLTDAEVLLMDEPFAAIDALLRVKLQQLLVDVWAQSRPSMIYVTHDLTEAIGLAHRIIVMGAHPGRIILERTIDEPHPRRVGEFRASPCAQALYGELWRALEGQMTE
jgi:NitT/TauT family transport system ATP-binding protein